jgi:hypothetical protein
MAGMSLSLDCSIRQRPSPCTEGCDHIQGRRPKEKASGFSGAPVDSLQMADDQLTAKFLSPHPPPPHCTQSCRHCLVVMGSQDPSWPRLPAVFPEECLRRVFPQF